MQKHLYELLKNRVLNNTGEDIANTAEPFFSDGYESGILKKNGILICKKG